MPKHVQDKQSKFGRKDIVVLVTGVGTCIVAALGTMGLTPLPSY